MDSLALGINSSNLFLVSSNFNNKIIQLFSSNKISNSIYLTTTTQALMANRFKQIKL